MSSFNRVKTVQKGPFATRKLARENAREFRRIGGTVLAGGRWVGGWHWSGTICVEDTQNKVSGSFGCGRCATTGQFITRVENGIPKGPGGQCFRCQGKGYHNHADRKRNLYHDMHFIPQ